MTFYQAELTLTPDELTKLGEQDLLPGMPIEAYMTTDQRTPRSYRAMIGTQASPVEEKFPTMTSISRKPQISFAVFIVVLGVMIGEGVWAVVFHEVFEQQHLMVAAGVMGVAAFIMIYTRPRKRIGAHQYLRFFYWSCAALLFPWAVLRQYFGEVTVNSFLFHLSEGVTGGILDGTIQVFLAAGVLILAFWYAVYVFLSLSRHANILLALAGVLYLALNPISRYMWDELVFWSQGQPKGVREHASDLVVAKAPDHARNLVIVYLEGLEATYENPVFGDAYEPIADLREDAISFTNIGQLAMTGWSVAGLVGSQCGLPTVRRGFRQGFRMESKRTFMPNRICLGDVLAEQGYQVEMILGADAKFGGFEAFLKSHSYDSIMDVRYLTENGATDIGAWGYQDGEVFHAGLARLEELERLGQPYALSLFTIGPHGPDGYISKECRTDRVGGSHPDVLIAVACTARLARDFVNKARDIAAPSTLFVVMSDHLAHPMVSATAQLKQFRRRNTLMFIGEGESREVIAKAGTMVDVYPTVLEALGHQLTDRKAGLGTSLFSDVVSFGADEDDRTTRQRLRQDLSFGQWLWADKRSGHN